MVCPFTLALTLETVKIKALLTVLTACLYGMHSCTGAGIPVCALVVVMNVSLIKQFPNSAVKLDSLFCGTPEVGLWWSPWKKHV